jgi:hypothetical protein
MVLALTVPVVDLSSPIPPAQHCKPAKFARLVADDREFNPDATSPTGV